MINLYIDDLRIVPENFVVARTYLEAIKILKKEEINILSLDHDLGIIDGEDKTGYDIVKFMCENGISPNYIYIHTDNVVGRKNMYETLLSAKKHGIIDEKTKIYNYACVPNFYED